MNTTKGKLRTVRHEPSLPIEAMEQDDDHTSFPPEWTLPDLPNPTAPSLSTAEFREIFGGSDEDSGLPLIGLQDDGPPLPSHPPQEEEDILLATMEESLEIKLPEEEVPTEGTTSVRKLRWGAGAVGGEGFGELTRQVEL